MIEIEEDRAIEMMERIENYILGGLTQKEIDALWLEFLCPRYGYSIWIHRLI
jgi:hypothetical protein